MTDEAWAAVQEGWHRKNLNKLYAQLKKDEPISLSNAEREHLRNALRWAAETIDDTRYEARFLREHEGYGPESAFACQVL